MRRLRIWAGILILTIAILLAWAGVASAHSFRTGSNVTLPQGETVNDTLFISGRNIDVSSEVFGDVFCMGQTISVSGTVHGDVICAGQTINVSGEVTGDVRLAGQTVTVSNSVTGNATIAGQSFNLESGGRIAGDATVASADSIFNGQVGRNIGATGSSLIIANTVGGEIKASVEKLTLTSGAKVTGNINYTSTNELQQDEGSTVGGVVTRSEPTQQHKGPRLSVYYGFHFGWFIYWLLAFLMITLALTLLFPRLLYAVSNRALPRPWKALLVGFLAGFVMPVILLILAITVIGLPLALLVGLAWLLIVLLSGPMFSFYIGRFVLRRSTHSLIIMLAGASILLVALFIPLIGLLAFLAAVWIGTGMILLEILDRTPRPVYNLDNTAKARAK